jgi:hypothetical protein
VNRPDKEAEYKEASKKRLMNNITKKFNTTTIGSLSIFEESFGFLWGHGIPHNELTDEERHWRTMWSEARTKILDLGNSNLRGSQSEISQYTLSWNKYVTHFYIKNQGDKDNG